MIKKYWFLHRSIRYFLVDQWTTSTMLLFCIHLHLTNVCLCVFIGFDMCSVYVCVCFTVAIWKTWKLMIFVFFFSANIVVLFHLRMIKKKKSYGFRKKKKTATFFFIYNYEPKKKRNWCFKKLIKKKKSKWKKFSSWWYIGILGFQKGENAKTKVT